MKQSFEIQRYCKNLYNELPPFAKITTKEEFFHSKLNSRHLYSKKSLHIDSLKRNIIEL